MDPLSAIGLACNILNFIEVTKGIISSTKQLVQRGAREEYIELDVLTRDLQAWVVRITPPSHIPGSSLSPEEQSICSLGSQCSQVAADLLGVLETLRVTKKDGACLHVESFYKALVAAWKQEEVERLRKRLDRISTSIQRELATYDRKKILRRLDELDVTGFGSQLEALRRDVHRGFDAISDQLQMGKTSRDSTLELLQRTAAQGVRYSAEQFILERLRFDEIDQRRWNIRMAHKQTLSWLFGDKQNSPATLDEWLVSEDDLYWISGKPGSGKSTLMKSLSANVRTAEKLQIWAKQNRLIHAEYFFWAAGGHRLLNSQEGLLRSLIYQVLGQCPDMIRVAYPKAWGLFFPEEASAAYGTRNFEASSAMVSLSVESLLATLGVLCATAVGIGVKFCFFIDGLDEYEGNPNDMVELTRFLRSLPNVKICVSSRDWNNFEAEFGGSRTQKFYMEHLNHNDIVKYVHHTFENNQNYQEMEDRDTAGKALINGIVTAANGVFFWVFLVVRSFEEGLCNGDSIEDLRKKLEEDIPEDLNELFERIILRDVPENYRAQSAQIFTLALEAAENLSFMAYWFAEQEDPEYALKLQARPLPSQTLGMRYATMKRRLNISCRGLLEMQDMLTTHTCNDKGDSLRSGSVFSLRVDFLHRTVRDFLLNDKTQTILRQWNSGIVNIHERICKALLAQIKITPNDAEYWGPVSRLHSVFSHHCDLMEMDSQMPSSLSLRASFNDVRSTLGYGKFQGTVVTDDDPATLRGSTKSIREDGCALSDHGTNYCTPGRLEKLLRGFRPRRPKRRVKELLLV
ncbi:hypothetical protein VMCG_01135 [Cytospora schulzeri]|uniref:Uncharacterized protein n=1 Tax=Cytospora schulzeri TaxID=448051 RepID=A0A423X5M8_9PEZI|nr:hypothetical protein VMCG_01135 [Valsa malicola]